MTNTEPIANGPPQLMHVDTTFGRFEIEARQVLSFPSGIPGFEGAHDWVLLSAPALEPLSLLQSVRGPAASFLVVDPRRAMPHYRCAVGQTDAVRLGVADDQVLLWLAIVSFEPDGAAYVNLRAPIVINPERMLGYQVMPHNSLYPLRHPLSSE
jgi:flagellar assembly factor FliW